MSRRRYKYLSDLIADDGTLMKTETTQVDNRNSMYAYPYKWRQLPQDIVFDILSRLSAQVIYEKRHVYKEWKLMTSTKDFIYNHLRNSNPGIIIIGGFEEYGIYVEIRRGCLEICKFDRGSFMLIGTSVNGLVLGRPSNYLSRIKHHLNVFNPLTKQHVGVPYGNTGICKTTLAFAEASMKYKVVRSYRPESLYCLGVLTIGVDKDWRWLDIEHISMLAQKVLIGEPFVTRGYVHWIGGSFVLTLNVETEIIHEFAKPKFLQYGFLASGRNVFSYYYSRLPDSRDYIMEVREMNPETGEWNMLFSSDLKPLSHKFKGLRSVHMLGMLVCGEVFLFGIARTEKRFATYNVRTREIQWFRLERSPNRCHWKAHVNSMVWLE